MHKFKIGDKVKVVDEQKMLDHSVPHHNVRQGTVTQVYDDGCVKLCEDQCGYWYPENCLDYDHKFEPEFSTSVTGLEPAQKTYTVREVLEASSEYGGYSGAPSDMFVDGVQKILDRRNDPDYTTYLELKKRFETKD